MQNDYLCKRNAYLFNDCVILSSDHEMRSIFLSMLAIFNCSRLSW